jgi:hypothetical protein
LNQIMWIRFLGTHEAYDKINAKEIYNETKINKNRKGLSKIIETA